MITLTTKATEQLKQFSEDEGIGHLCVRVKVCGGKCSGLFFDLLFDDMTNEIDNKWEQDGITIICDDLSLSYMGTDTIIDHIESDFGSGFKFIGDESKKSCGCGSSFSI